MRVFEVAHIYPSALLRDKPDCKRQVEVWGMLKLFWPPGKVAAWRAAVDKNKSDIYGEKPFNMLCLNPLAKALWDIGAFALKPISISEDKKILTMQFFWQAEREQGMTEIDLLAAPLSTRYLDGAYGCWLAHGDERMKSGHIVTMSTNDPIAFPLPSLELLEIQWFCRRVLAMAGPSQGDEWLDEESDECGQDDVITEDEDYVEQEEGEEEDEDEDG